MPKPSPHHSPPRRPRTDSSSSTDASRFVKPGPARPSLRNNLDLEPNPFEQSFSASSNSSSSISSLRNAVCSNPSPPPDKKSPSVVSTARVSGGHSRKTSLNNVSNADTPKPILPPLASITSPSDPSYPWSFSSAGLANSLRSGPLSPAMLAGPQPQPPVSVSQPAASVAALAASAASTHPPLFSFDASGTFRTGLTPSTGLTPLVGGPVSFPPPSPNTAAFLDMVSSGSAASAAATITPNTLNALTGVLQQHTASQQQQQQQQQQSHPSNTSRQGVPSSSAPPSTSAASIEPVQSSYSNGSSASQRYATNDAYTQSDNNSGSSHYANASNAANHAANGLFLLSQAHQELTKREEAQKLSMAQSNGDGGANGSATQTASNGSTATKRGSKRKGDAASVSSGASAKASATKRTRTTGAVAANTRGAARRESTTASSNQDVDDYVGEDDEDSDEDGMQQQTEQPAGKSSHPKKTETEEEKRRNFLERNRQAALKCRQRKKAWLAQLQAKVEFLANENERLTAALVSSREEISRLSQLVGGAGVGLPIAPQGMGVGVGAPLAGIGMSAVQQQHQVHHAPYVVHPRHPVSVAVSVPQGASAGSPPMTNKGSPHQQPQQQSPHSPASEGRSSRSSMRDVRDYGNGRDANNGRDYARDVREREMNGHMHGHAPQAVAVNGRGYGY